MGRFDLAPQASQEEYSHINVGNMQESHLWQKIVRRNYDEETATWYF